MISSIYIMVQKRAAFMVGNIFGYLVKNIKIEAAHIQQRNGTSNVSVRASWDQEEEDEEEKMAE